MSLEHRLNVHVSGDGPSTTFFAHGFGCDQNIWRLLAPSYATRYRTVLFDLAGSGSSDLSAYSSKKYASLQGYADDLLELVHEYSGGRAIFVGHSVSAMFGMVADVKASELFAAHVSVGPPIHSIPRLRRGALRSPRLPGVRGEGPSLSEEDHGRRLESPGRRRRCAHA